MHFISSATGCLYVRTRLPRYKKPKAHPTRFCLCPKGNSHHCHFLCGLRSVRSFQITVAWVYSVSAQTSFNYPQNKQVCRQRSISIGNFTPVVHGFSTCTQVYFQVIVLVCLSLFQHHFILFILVLQYVLVFRRKSHP